MVRVGAFIRRLSPMRSGTIVRDSLITEIFAVYVRKKIHISIFDLHAGITSRVTFIKCQVRIVETQLE